MGDIQDPTRADFPHYLAIPTRWSDCDVYGHVNNVVYYSYFDTAVTGHLVSEGELKPMEAPVIGVVVETRCQFRQELGFPDVIDAGIKVVRLGKSSVSYEIGLFRQNHAEPAAFGTFAHVWIDRVTRRPTAVPDTIRAALQPLCV
ncbi:MAG: acyl-CoA thioesterase [Alphaproteobacteria bacterium]|nr:acyl-CoA thioesterase [Alphaproteobacteria bacterium]